MTSLKHSPVPFRLIQPDSAQEWAQADRLITELKEWDVQQSRALGFEGEEVLSTFYPASLADIRRDSVPPEGGFLLAMDADLLLGCAAFHRLTATECELYDVYVRPEARGRGVASVLLRRLMSDAKAAGYRAMVLETAVFMREAHRLYRALQFEVRSPYRVLPQRFAAATVWMECRLSG
jgi:ribosomal protein S18 acetylase RimI-like enzyme